MTAQLLNGRTLAASRAAAIRRRAQAVFERRARPPALLLVAFADDRGAAPHIGGKRRAAEAVGVAVHTLVLGNDANTDGIVSQMQTSVAMHRPDAVFLQVPFPSGVDEALIISAIPVDSDVDVMTAERVSRYMGGVDLLPPVTVDAALLLLDAYHLPIEGRRCTVIAEESDFATMFREAFRRRGAIVAPRVDPAARDLGARIRNAEIVVVAVAEAGFLKSDLLPVGAVAIDVGYYNAGRRGDIDTTAGTDHLTALVPVPGGIGPMTVSALVERVVLFAESRNGER
jgi:methylenetetrahydrofolate dehydrogenase (NADP+) / methenyltetrahydrofolate cyclohydrolase